MNKFGIGGGAGFLRAIFDAVLKARLAPSVAQRVPGDYDEPGKPIDTPRAGKHPGSNICYHRPAGSKLSRHCARRHLHSHMWG